MRVLLAVMSRAALAPSNKIGGVYAAPVGATGVSVARAPGAGRFSGSAGGVVVALGLRLADGRADRRQLVGPIAIGGNPPFFASASGLVAWPAVAWPYAGRRNASVSGACRLIAHLTTGGPVAVGTPSPASIGAPSAAGGLPPSRRRACPHARRGSATGKLENRRPGAFLDGGYADRASIANVHDGKSGSGVRPTRVATGSGAEAARFGTTATGRGQMGTGLGNGRGGKSARLCPAPRPVNGRRA